MKGNAAVDPVQAGRKNIGNCGNRKQPDEITKDGYKLKTRREKNGDHHIQHEIADQKQKRRQDKDFIMSLHTAACFSLEYTRF